ncbi:MAG: hypothetical protein ACU836_15555, partial [Gammaproteobacteria bacterium]
DRRDAEQWGEGCKHGQGTEDKHEALAWNTWVRIARVGLACRDRAGGRFLGHCRSNIRASVCLVSACCAQRHVGWAACCITLI